MTRQLALILSGLIFFAVTLMACTPTAAPVADVATAAPERPTATATVTSTATTSPAADLATAVPPTPTQEPTLVAPEKATMLSRTPTDITIQDRQPVIELNFSQPMDAASVAAALIVSPDIRLQLGWEANTLVIVPESALFPGTTYRFTLDDTAVSQSGAPLNRSYSWQYRLPALLTVPRSPVITAEGMELNLHFNYPVNPETIAFRFEPALSVSQVWDAANQNLRITSPTIPGAGVTYTLHFEGEWLDENGAALPLPFPETVHVPGAIARVFPENDSNVSPATAVSLQFNRPMDQERTRAAFRIEPHVPGFLEWHDNVLELHSLTDRLLPNTTYVVTLDVTAVDSSGNPVLSEPYIWSFTTEELQALSNFGRGAQVQVLAQNGPQSVQFTVFQTAPDEVSFDLYRVNWAGWLDGSAWEGGELVQSWAEDTTAGQSWYAIPHQTSLPTVAAGVYRLELRTGNYVEDRLLLFVSDYLLVVKEDTDELLVWLTDNNGQAIADMEVTVYQEAAAIETTTIEAAAVAHGRTAADGTVRIPVSLQPDRLYKVVAGQGEAVIALALSGEFGSGSRARSSARYQIATYTDRPVYYPGDDLLFRTIIRWSEDAAPQIIPAGTAVTVALQQFDENDWRWQDVANQTLNTSHFGTADGRFTLPTAPGKYQLLTTIADQTYTTSFTVQPHNDAPFTVAVTTDAPIYADGADIAVTIDVVDASGQPVAEANVEIELLESGNADCFGTPTGSDTWYSSYQDALHRRTDENGRVSLTLPAEIGYFTHSDGRNGRVQHGMWAIKATVNQGGESVGGFAIAEVATVAEIATLQINGHLQTPGAAFPVTTRLTDLMGSPLAGEPLTLKVMAFSIQANDFIVQQQTIPLQTDVDGRAATQLTIHQPGEYRLLLAGQDAWGHTVEAEQTVVVYDAAYGGQYGRDSFSINTDQDAHVIGQTARLLVKSSFSGPALLTISRGTLARYQTVQLTAPLTLVELPLLETDAPNVHLTLNAWQPQTLSFTADPDREVTWYSLPDYTLQTASLNLMVSNPKYSTDIVIDTDKEVYQPGETAEITVRVTNGDGEGVSAEVGLALVDAAIYAHHSPHTGSLTAVFHNQEGNYVLGYDALRPLRSLYGEEFGGCGCGGWWDEPGEPVNTFDNSVFWLPAVVTDHNGEARITVTLPTTAGQWRLSAYGVTADTQVGETAVTIATQ